MDLARTAFSNGEVPVAALLCHMPAEEQWEIVSESPNRILELADPTAHAEMIVIREAAKRLGSERLPGFNLVSSLEPCMMCTGASVLARLETIYYFAPEKKGPGVAPLLQFTKEWPGSPINHYPRIVHLREMEGEAASLLRSFFKERRRKDTDINPSLLIDPQ